MKITVVGAGSVGVTLAKGWAKSGHDVVLGVRDPLSENAVDVRARFGSEIAVEPLPGAISGADVIVLAVPWTAAEEAVKSLGDLSGRVLLDVTNPLLGDLSGLTHGHTTSGAEQIASWAAGADVVKIFNTTGVGNMADPSYPGGAAAMLYCGDGDSAKALANELAVGLGFDAIDAGPLSQARLLEPFALLWIHLVYKQGLGTNIAFLLGRR